MDVPFDNRPLNELVFLHGVEEVFNALYALKQRSLKRSIQTTLWRMRCEDRETHGQDIEQLVWMIVHKRLKKLREEESDAKLISSLDGWLFAIQLHLCIEDIMQERNTVPLDSDEDFTIPDRTGSFISTFETKVESELLASEIRVIAGEVFFNASEERRMAFTMYINGFKHREIEALLGLAEGTSRTWISRATREMRQKLGFLNNK